MSNKEALRELQTRLAGRLQLARDEVASAAWLAVRVGSLNALLPLTQSGEIFGLPAIAKVPYAQPWLLGVVNLRGGLYSAVDLASFMSGQVSQVRSEQAWAQVRLVTFNPELELNCALMVDALLGEIGIIDEVLEMPQQEMAFLKYKERDVLVPLNEQFIQSIDEANRQVMVDLPDGLLD